LVYFAGIQGLSNSKNLVPDHSLIASIKKLSEILIAQNVQSSEPGNQNILDLFNI
jgi:hypothetical protein